MYLSISKNLILKQNSWLKTEHYGKSFNWNCFLYFNALNSFIRLYLTERKLLPLKPLTSTLG